MKRFAIAAAILALLSGVLFKGTFGHWLVVIAAGVYLGTPLALFMGLWLVIGLKRTGEVPRGHRTTLFVLLIIAGSLLVSLGIGTAIHHWEIREARNYVAGIVPELDGYRKTHGRYPETLAALGTRPPPSLLNDPHSYFAEPDYFSFMYWNAAGMMDGYTFDSTSRKWSNFD